MNENNEKNTLPHINELSEEEIYKILQEDTENIEPPESLSPANIEQKLKGITQVSNRRPSKIIAIAGMAACLVLGVFAGVLTYSLINGKTDDAGERTAVADNSKSDDTAPNPDAVSEDGLNYEKVCDIINRYNENNRRIYDDYVEDAVGGAMEKTEDAATETEDNAKQESNNSGASDDYSRTDTQVNGVDEGDIVKTDGKHIFTIESSTFGFMVHVIEPNGSSSKMISTLEVQGSNCAEMYLSGDRMIVIGNSWNQNAKRGGAMTAINFIDISDAANPKLLKTVTQSGGYNTSRISDGYLYTFTEDVYYSDVKYDVGIPENYIPMINDKLVKPEDIVRAGTDDTNNYMVMTSIPVEGDIEIKDSLSVLGGGATYYVSTDHIYIARYSNGRDVIGEFFGNYTPITCLTKFTYDNGEFVKNVSASFRGQIGNSYYMHEYQGNFCFVYTAMDNSGEPINGLCVLDGNLQKLGELGRIAPGETIYSSYFIDNMAYFVTYRNTDPVFAVDMSDPTNPKLRSELHLPGFSSYLHSFGDGKLIGIGYGAVGDDTTDNTAKISLFELGSDYSIKELTKVLADANSRHIADSNHKAVFVDEERMIIGLGMNRYDMIDDDYQMQEFYCCYQLNGDKLVKVLDTRDEKEQSVFSTREARGVRIGETFYLCNSQGFVKAYNIGKNGAKWTKAD